MIIKICPSCKKGTSRKRYPASQRNGRVYLIFDKNGAIETMGVPPAALKEKGLLPDDSKFTDECLECGTEWEA